MSFFLTLLTLSIATFVTIEGLRLSYYGFKAHLAGKKTVPFSTHPQNPTKRVLVIGDSTSYGTGALNPIHSLYGRLAQDFPSIEITNKSVNALNSAGLLTVLRNNTEPCDMLMMHIGGIDTLSFTPKKRLEKIFASVAQHIKEQNIPVAVLVSVNNVGLSPFVRFPLKTLFNRRSETMHFLFERIAQQHGFIHISLYARPGEDELAQDPNTFFAGDKIHPNDAGYAIWYQKIKHALTLHLPQ